MLLFVGSVCFVAGCVLTGFVANRKPDLFAKVVKVANTVDNAVNTAAAKK